MKSKGTIHVRENRIHIECLPHVAIKLRRLFGGMKRDKNGELGSGKFELSATPESAYDLAWFSLRYKLDVAPASASQFEKLRSTHENRLEAIDHVLSGGDGYVPPKFELALPPREYQRVAADLCTRTGRTLIGDDLGIGKTVSAICVLVAEDKLPAVVVTLTHLQRQWQRELAKFAPRLKTHIVTKTQPYKLHQHEVVIDPTTKRRRVVRGEQMPDVIIINYNKLQGWADELGGRMKTVIYDEVQELRHNTTKRYEAATAIGAGANCRVGLSATPIYNYGSEVHSVISQLAPDALGTREEFIQEWCGGPVGGDDKKAKVRDPAALGTYLRESGLMIRRTRKDVGRELPDLTIVRQSVECDDGALTKVAADVAELARRVLERIGDRTDRMRQAGELDWKLRQATGISKANSVVAFVQLLVESGERVLLYGWHHAVYDIWESKLREAGIEVRKFTGEESTAQKERAASDFKEGRAPVLIMSLRSGAGLDGLQFGCRTVVVGELDWSPGVQHQAIGRVHRDGQTDPVMAYVLVADEGSDPVIADVLGIKEHQSEGIRNPDTANSVDPQLVGADENHIRKLAEEFLKRANQVKTA